MKATDLPTKEQLERLLDQFIDDCTPQPMVLKIQQDPVRPAPMDPVKELLAYTGMDEVKQAVMRELSYHKIMKMRRQAGRKTPQRLTHLLLTGNPGVGKTTIARLITRIYSDAGILRTDTFIECNRSTLVGRYIGETEAKTRQIIDQARGGVLFIDELYALAETTDDESTRDFGARAIDTLIPVLSDPGANIMVIGAGYPDRMRNFVRSNPGLASRFPVTIPFADYTIQQLMEIARKEISQYEFTITEDCEAAVRSLIEQAMRFKDFGNARFVKTLISNFLIPNFCIRIDNTYDDAAKGNLNTIELQDVPQLETVLPMACKRQSIGFNR